ncbi:MAG TPA: hypothetical protein V6C58_01675 [Allocoleopsis sp.]
MNKFGWYYDNITLKMLETYILIPNISLKFMLIYGEPNDDFNNNDSDHQETVIGWRLQLNFEHWQSVFALKFIHLKSGYEYDD